jgi:predicted secreted protein
MANSDKNIRITGNKNTTTGIFPKIVFTGASAGTSVVTLEVLDDNTVSFTSNEGQIFSLDSNLSTGTIWSVNDISGYPLLRADVGAASGATIRIAEGLGNVGIGETNPVFKFNVKGALGIGSTTTTSYTVFRFPSAGLGQSYVLPDNYPSGTGTSFLSASTTGVMAWVAPPAGGGSGGVNSGTAGSVAFYNTTGTTVSGSNVLSIPASGAAISAYARLDMRSGQDIRLWNTSNNQYTALFAGNNSASYNLIFPTAPVFAGSGYSTILVDTSGNMFFAPVEGGMATTSATGNRVVLRNRMEHHVWMAAGYTPLAAGADNIVYLIPDSSDDGATKITFQLKEFTIRVETPSAGSSRIQLEKSSTDTGAFTLAATGSSLIGGSGLTITGAGIYVTTTNTFAAGTLVTSGNLLSLNWTLLNATHANFSVQFTLNEV